MQPCRGGADILTWKSSQAGGCKQTQRCPELSNEPFTFYKAALGTRHLLWREPCRSTHRSSRGPVTGCAAEKRMELLLRPRTSPRDQRALVYVAAAHTKGYYTCGPKASNAQTRTSVCVVGTDLFLQSRVGNLFPPGPSDICNVIHGSYKTINLKTSLLYWVKHLISLPLMPWQGQTQRVPWALYCQA